MLTVAETATDGGADTHKGSEGGDTLFSNREVNLPRIQKEFCIHQGN